MTVVLAFAIALLLAVLLSELARRSLLSIAVLFLVSGFLIGDGVLGIVSLGPENPAIGMLTELALFSVLFTDGMRVGVRELASAWRLPGRALLLGLPLTLAGTALLARLVAGLPWAEALLLGAALSPTDPVFAAAIVGREEVPQRLRHLLNVESGVNDGLALPVVLVMLAVVNAQAVEVGTMLGELALGVVLGVVVPWAAIRLERSRLFAASPLYEPLNAFAIGLLVLALASLTHANEFLAAFSAGVMVATLSPEVRDAFHAFGEILTELLKLAALLVFGVLMAPSFLAEIPTSGYVFAFLALLVVRPIALGIALLGSGLDGREQVAAAWFGPKGFASVVYGILILKADIAQGDELFHLLAIVIAGSIIAHSSTDVMVARWFQQAEAEPAELPSSRGG
jgi:sodium/hydrogen antiporter